MAEERSVSPREEGKMNNQEETPIACISGELVGKTSAELTNFELAAFIEQGAWRVGAGGSDETAYREAAKRLRTLPSVQGGLVNGK